MNLATGTVLGLSLLVASAADPAGPVPPCGATAVPAYASVDAEPATRHWAPKDVAKDWKLPACVPWESPKFESLVTVAGRFRHNGSADDLLVRFASISTMKGVRYWSRTHNDWRTFIEDASALSSASAKARRKDFTNAELRRGEPTYFLQADNVAGDAVYQLRVMEATPNRLVVAMDNVSTVKKYLMTILHPHDAQSVFFLDRESGDVWKMYAIMRIGDNANKLAAGNPGSAINRAVAFYRHFAGIRTDKDPPAAK